MVVGPEFGPIAGFCVALVQRRGPLALRSLGALAAGFPAGIAAAFLITIVFKATGVIPEDFDISEQSLADVIANPDFLSFFVAFCAGMAGVLSLTSAKSGALIGVLISVTTIPAASNVGVAAAYEDWSTSLGSLKQLGINLAAIVAAGLATLTVQRVLYGRRRRAHVRELGELAVTRPDRATTRSRPSSPPASAPRK
jgi:uncharacterized hydrophobic protein (TIGR00271 family)